MLVPLQAAPGAAWTPFQTPLALPVQPHGTTNVTAHADPWRITPTSAAAGEGRGVWVMASACVGGNVTASLPLVRSQAGRSLGCGRGAWQTASEVTPAERVPCLA